ncbi:MAG: anti-sigma factor [Alphaproteobacteria bacterium]|nr:anti-sigma factor [Alphaproteobacteria bacterium]
MRAVSRSIEEDDLQAWVDGRLTRADNQAVEAYFTAHPELRKRWSQYAAQREELRAALAGPGEEPIPARLRIARLMAEQRRGRHRQLARIAAAVALLIAGGIGGWGAHDLLPALNSSASAVLAGAVFDDAIAAHRTFSVEIRHPVEVGANEETHLVQWLSKRLGRQLIVPDLGALGFRLMGGRLLPADSGPAALFMYEDGKGTRLSCYYLVVGVAGETEFQFREQNGISAFYWVDGGLAYAIAANVPRDLLLRVAEIIYKQNTPDGAKAKLPPAPGKPS